jgi:two-component system, LuxR family, secretion system response regulator SsrB
MVEKTRILIIDAQSLMRDGLAALLNSEPDLQVIGAIGKGSAIGRVSLSAAPDLVILDVDLPDYRGAETIKLISVRWPKAKIMVLTFQQSAQAMDTALRAGVDAYLLKSDTRSELNDALHHLALNKRFLTPSLSSRAAEGPQHTLVRPEPPDGLSSRERDVLRRIAQGRRTREIAHELSLSHKTIEKYRSNLMRKLGLKTATAVAAYAIANGYLNGNHNNGSLDS